MITDSFEIKRLLLTSNHHWATGNVLLPKNLTLLYRPQFETLLANLDKPQILGLIGMRRVGKSVIMQQLMHFISTSHPAKNICQVSFDEEMVSKNPDVLDHLIETAIAINADKNNGRFFFFIDEIQFVKNWQHILKRYYDRRRDVKFIVSGSSSLFIRKRTTESLSGRILEYEVPPLAFWEYLTITNESSDSAKRLSKLNINLEKPDPLIFQELKEIQLNNAILCDRFDEYICCGQFPEAASWSSEDAYEYIRNSIYKKTLLYDIPRLFQIRRPDELAFLYSVLMRETGNLLEITNLASSTGINRNTISSYLDYLREALLHIQLTNATSTIREQKRLLKKGYVPSPNFMTTFLKLDRQNPLWQKESGHVAETFVANVLFRTFKENLHFYRKGDLEVDFVTTPLPGQLKNSLFVEVKYSDTVIPRNLKPLIHLAKDTDSKRAICITKNITKVEDIDGIKLFYLPIWALQ